MKKQEHPAVAAFKTRVDRAEESLKDFGYKVTRNHLMDILSRFEGERDWKRYKVKLESLTASAEQAQPHKLPVMLDMRGKTAHMFINSSSRAHQTCTYLKIDQNAANYLDSLVAEHVLAIMSQGMDARTVGKMKVCWFDDAIVKEDVSEIRMDGMDMVIQCRQDDPLWGAACTWELDIYEIRSVVEEAILRNDPVTFIIDDQERVWSMLQNVANSPAFAELRSTGALKKQL